MDRRKRRCSPAKEMSAHPGKLHSAGEVVDVLGHVHRDPTSGAYFVLVKDSESRNIDIDALNTVTVFTNSAGQPTLLLETKETSTATSSLRRLTRSDRISSGGNSQSLAIQKAKHGVQAVELSKNSSNDDKDADARDSSIHAETAASSTAKPVDPDAETPAAEDLENTDENYIIGSNGMRLRRSRVHGSCRCPECGETFVNTARLERHLSVHQVFGSFLCPLCGKTYKYEYNLFFHWRKNCRDLAGLLDANLRQTLDVNQLREMVDRTAQKKAEIGPIDVGLSQRVWTSGASPLAPLEIPQGMATQKFGRQCNHCNILVPTLHMRAHVDIHQGRNLALIGARNAAGGHFCDLCGLMYRHEDNLLKHWRQECAEVQANIMPEDVEQLFMLPVPQLLQLVAELMRASVTKDAFGVKTAGDDHEYSSSLDNVDANAADGDAAAAASSDQHDEAASSDRIQEKEKEPHVRQEEEQQPSTSLATTAHDAGTPSMSQMVFADDYVDSDVNDGAFEDTTKRFHTNESNEQREKWSLDLSSSGAEGSSFSVSCPECFRVFANLGRLERHMAGMHASNGSHHCILCGNRFKYDYNLLYHYRHSCPYARNFIPKEFRESVDAMQLRRQIRDVYEQQIANKPTQNVGPLAMQRAGQPSASTAAWMNRLKANRLLAASNLRRQLGGNDAIVRRRIFALNKPTNPRGGAPPVDLSAQQSSSSSSTGQPKNACPICGIVFYHEKGVERHLEVAHPEGQSTYQRGGGATATTVEDDEDAHAVMPVLEAEAMAQDEAVDLEQALMNEGLSVERFLQLGHEVPALYDYFVEVQRLYETGEIRVDEILHIEPDGQMLIHEPMVGHMMEKNDVGAH